MFLSLLSDDTLMAKANIAKEYDLHTSHVDRESEINQYYGEIHTTAGLDVRYEPTKTHFLNEPEGLR